MKLNDYQQKASETVSESIKSNILYFALGLNGEAGEIAEKTKKFLRDGKMDWIELAKENGDTLWYYTSICSFYELNMYEFFLEINQNKLDKNEGDLYYHSLKLNNNVSSLSSLILLQQYNNYAFDALDFHKKMVDLLYSIFQIAKCCGLTLEEVAQMNIDKLQSRKSRGKISGSGDNR